MKHQINTPLLKGILVANNMSVNGLGKALGVSSVTIYRKVNGIRPFTAGEIQGIAKLLNLTRDLIDQIFFPEIVFSEKGI